MLPKPNNPMRRTRGYTLIEMLIVVGLLGLAGSLIVPYLVGRDTMALQAAVRHLIADLTYAQSEALAQQGIRRVHFYEDGSGYCLLEIDPANFNAEFDPSIAMYVPNPAGWGGTNGNFIVEFTEGDRFEGITVSSVNIDGGNNYVSYDELGGTARNSSQPGVGGTITLKNEEDESYTIHIAPFTGKLTVEKVD